MRSVRWTLAACSFALIGLGATPARAERVTRHILRESFENHAVGSMPAGVEGIAQLRAGHAAIEVTDADAAAGRRSLVVVDAPGLARPWWPYRRFYLRGRKRIRVGDVRLSLDIKIDKAAPGAFTIETRDWSKGAYKSGPKLELQADGAVVANGRRLPVTVALGQWSHVDIAFKVGPKAPTAYTLSIASAGQAAQTFDVPFDPNVRMITWVGFISYNEKRSVFYLDNINLSVTSQRKVEPVRPKYTDFVMRGNLMRSYNAFAKAGHGRVAFMGGSVTTRAWREPVMEAIEQRFPKTEFDFIMAGIGGTNAELGAFRLPSHVFGRGPVDLFFLEFAVNGGGVRAMEGIVRQARRLNPNIDIVILYFANTSHTKSFNSGQIPGIVQDHEKVAERYGAPALYLYREIARRIQQGLMTWDDFSGDSVHPNDDGCEIYADCVNDFLAEAWKDPSAASAGPVAELPAKLDPLCFDRGRFVDVDQAKIKDGFTRVRDWTTDKTCNFRPPVDVLAAEAPGAELSLEFEGRAIGVYTIVGMDTGQIEYAIDGGPFKTLDPFDHYCPRFHRPQHTLFAQDLAPGRHRLVLRSGRGKNAKSEGHAIRILKFMVN